MDIANQLKESMGQATETTEETAAISSPSVAQQIADETLEKLKTEVTECLSIGLKEWIESGAIVADVLQGGKWKPDFSNGKQIANKPVFRGNQILTIAPTS